jgi:hypothetical protein
VNDLDTLEAIVAAARHNSSVGDDVTWLQDTADRIRVRYALALHGLADMPALIGHLGAVQVPENAAEAAIALEDVLSGVMDQLEGIGEYLRAVADPGSAYCQTCRLPLAVFHGHDGWQHYEVGPADAPALARRQQLITVDHDTIPGFDRPERPDWSTVEGDLEGGAR